MLEGKNGGRHKHRHLLGVTGCLECCTHRHFGLSKPDITADQPVHRTGTLHICLYVIGSLQLIRRILIEEGCFQLVLHEGVAREGKPFLLQSLGINLDQVAGDVLNPFLGTFLQPVPRSCAKC